MNPEIAAGILASLPEDVREWLEELAARLEISPAEAIETLLSRERSLDEIQGQGWRLLVEKDGDVRPLAEVS